jgi:hypothetical protein
MEKIHTIRGFDLYEFKDRSKAECTLQKSSIATEDCIWLGTDDGPRMLLTQSMVAELLPILKTFVETGEI